jgi:hypothetical protein
MTNHRLESDSEILKAWLDRHEVYYLDTKDPNSQEIVARTGCRRKEKSGNPSLFRKSQETHHF